MDWYLAYTKFRQEQRAFRNLDQQRFECFLPMLAVEKLCQGALVRAEDPLFPRYLFARADATDFGARWGTVCSTKGVSRLVAFGKEPARVSLQLLDKLHSLSNAAMVRPQGIFRPGEGGNVPERRASAFFPTAWGKGSDNYRAEGWLLRSGFTCKPGSL